MAYRGDKAIFDGLLGGGHIVELRNIGCSSPPHGFQQEGSGPHHRHPALKGAVSVIDISPSC